MHLRHFRGWMHASIFLCNAVFLGLPLHVSLRGYAQQPYAELQAPSYVPPPVAIASHDLDALAKKMAEEISKKKIGGVVVVGGGGPEGKVSELGAKLRDAFNDSLARQAQRVHVLDGAAMRAMLRQNRVSEGMLYSDVIAPWIAAHAQVDAYVTFRIYGLSGNHASVVSEFFMQDKKGFQSIHKESGALELSSAQQAAADSDFQPEMNNPGALPISSYPSSIKCLECPNPSYADEGRRLKISGIVQLMVVVRADGVADDIMVVRPLGHGLDASAIDAVLAWKFQPAKDAQGQAVATQVSVEVSFTLK